MVVILAKLFLCLALPRFVSHLLNSNHGVCLVSFLVNDARVGCLFCLILPHRFVSLALKLLFLSNTT